MWAREISGAEPSHEYEGNEQLAKDVLYAASRLASLEEENAGLRVDKDTAYRERNRLVLFLTRCYPSHRCSHPESDVSWERDWRNIICVHGPVGLMTWHIHDSELRMFEHLPFGESDWDGHTTEEKYQRLYRCDMNSAAIGFLRNENAALRARAEKAESALCKAREAWESENAAGLESIFDESPPCRHAELATRWYLADGTFEVLPEEEVIRRRIEAAGVLKRAASLSPGRECGEDTDYGRGWDAGVRASQAYLLKKEG
ncbi:MAG: hypothetical protein WA058_01225, partial [Minisyncoccia bacterium]